MKRNAQENSGTGFRARIIYVDLQAARKFYEELFVKERVRLELGILLTSTILNIKYRLEVLPPWCPSAKQFSDFCVAKLKRTSIVLHQEIRAALFKDTLRAWQS